MTSHTAVMRLKNDLRAITFDPPAGISAQPISDENLLVWNATIIGPDESCWEGGVYNLNMIFPENYPDQPPKIRFITQMYHPNIFPDGSICLDIIQKKWSPIYTVSSILTSIQSLLTDPNPDSPANPDAARLYTTDPKQYRKMVRKCAERSVA